MSTEPDDLGFVATAGASSSDEAIDMLLDHLRALGWVPADGAEGQAAEIARLRRERDQARQWNDEARQSLAARQATMAVLRATLARLVALKDGPRDATYEREKTRAWQAARNVLGAAQSPLTDEQPDLLPPPAQPTNGAQEGVQGVIAQPGVREAIATIDRLARDAAAQTLLPVHVVPRTPYHLQLENERLRITLDAVIGGKEAADLLAEQATSHAAVLSALGLPDGADPVAYARNVGELLRMADQDRQQIIAVWRATGIPADADIDLADEVRRLRAERDGYEAQLGALEEDPPEAGDWVAADMHYEALNAARAERDAATEAARLAEQARHGALVAGATTVELIQRELDEAKDMWHRAADQAERLWDAAGGGQYEDPASVASRVRIAFTERDALRAEVERIQRMLTRAHKYARLISGKGAQDKDRVIFVADQIDSALHAVNAALATPPTTQTDGGTP